MQISGIRIGRASQTELDRVLAASRDADVTYQHVGSTLAGAGTWSDHVDLEGGDAAFGAAVDALRAWVPHRGINARIHPRDAVLETGTTLLVVAPFGPFEMAAPNRIVAVVDEPDRFGFAYATLPGHPERGEESFVVERTGDQAVRLTITVDAVPSTALGRLLAPLVRRFQRAALHRYLRAVESHVEESS